MSSCSLCPWGTLPNPPDAGHCFSCSSPDVLLYSYSNPLVSYTDAICVSCPLGYGVTYASCTQCLDSTIRPLGSLTCFECPPGFTANSSHTIRIPCSVANPSYPVRGAGQPYCYSCPAGYIANADLSKCISESGTQELKVGPVLFASFGIMLLLVVAIFHKHMKKQVSIVTAGFGFVLLGFGLALFFLDGTNQPSPVSGTAVLKVN